MAKFCNQCGKPLEEGEVCSCQSQTAAQPQPVPTPASTNVSAEQVTKQVQGAAQAVATQGANVFKKMIDIFKNPIGAVKQIAATEDKVSAFSMVITNVLTLSIITLIVCLAFNSEAGGLIKLPVAKMVLTVLFTAAAADFALAACLWVATKFFFKEDVSYIKILSVTGAKLLIDSVFVILGSILTIVSAKIGIFIYAVGSIFTTVLFVQSYAEVSTLDKDKKFYAMTIAMTLFIILVVVFTSLCLKDTMDSIKSISNLLA